jgi:hypothetical protein
MIDRFLVLIDSFMRLIDLAVVLIDSLMRLIDLRGTCIDLFPSRTDVAEVHRL